MSLTKHLAIIIFMLCAPFVHPQKGNKEDADLQTNEDRKPCD